MITSQTNTQNHNDPPWRGNSYGGLGHCDEPWQSLAALSVSCYTTQWEQTPGASLHTDRGQEIALEYTPFPNSKFLNSSPFCKIDALFLSNSQVELWFMLKEYVNDNWILQYISISSWLFAVCYPLDPWLPPVQLSASVASLLQQLVLKHIQHQQPLPWA